MSPKSQKTLEEFLQTVDSTENSQNDDNQSSDSSKEQEEQLSEVESSEETLPKQVDKKSSETSSNKSSSKKLSDNKINQNEKWTNQEKELICKFQQLYSTEIVNKIMNLPCDLNIDKINELIANDTDQSNDHYLYLSNHYEFNTQLKYDDQDLSVIQSIITLNPKEEYTGDNTNIKNLIKIFNNHRILNELYTNILPSINSIKCLIPSKLPEIVNNKKDKPSTNLEKTINVYINAMTNVKSNKTLTDQIIQNYKTSMKKINIQYKILDKAINTRIGPSKSWNLLKQATWITSYFKENRHSLYMFEIKNNLPRELYKLWLLARYNVNNLYSKKDSDQAPYNHFSDEFWFILNIWKNVLDSWPMFCIFSTKLNYNKSIEKFIEYLIKHPYSIILFTSVLSPIRILVFPIVFSNRARQLDTVPKLYKEFTDNLENNIKDILDNGYTLNKLQSEQYYLKCNDTYTTFIKKLLITTITF